MEQITAASQALGLVQLARANASAFCTNFFASPARLEAWVRHGELFADQVAGSVFLLRRIRDFWHLHFAAPDPQSLRAGLAASPWLSDRKISADVVAPAAGLEDASAPLAQAGLRPYASLTRMACLSQQLSRNREVSSEVCPATPADIPAILDLLENQFNPYSDQLPVAYELEAAIAASQVLALRDSGRLAAFLHLENQGQTSTLRFWVVAPEFQGRGHGSTLIRAYFDRDPQVRRFLLWVNTANERALRLYRNYGYQPDLLTDRVLVNQLIGT